MSGSADADADTPSRRRDGGHSEEATVRCLLLGSSTKWAAMRAAAVQLNITLYARREWKAARAKPGGKYDDVPDAALLSRAIAGCRRRHDKKS